MRAECRAVGRLHGRATTRPAAAPEDVQPARQRRSYLGELIVPVQAVQLVGIAPEVVELPGAPRVLGVEPPVRSDGGGSHAGISRDLEQERAMQRHATPARNATDRK